MTSLEKIQKVMGVFATLTRIGMILAYVAVALLLAGAGLLRSNGLMEKAPLLGSFVDVTGVTTSQALWLLLATAVSTLFGGVLLTLFYRYFTAEAADGTPFTIGGAERVKRLGLCSIVFSVVSMGITDTIYEEAGLSAWHNFDNADGVMLGVCLILLSLVLKYGAELEEKVSAAQRRPC